MTDLAFEGWMEKVDQVVEATAGVSVHDLADYDFWNAWNDGESPQQVAKAMLIEEGFYA